jgi:hypothetical protein
MIAQGVNVFEHQETEKGLSAFTEIKKWDSSVIPPVEGVRVVTLGIVLKK